jgi:glycosyltransferase involved in cell wall biosynthesis
LKILLASTSSGSRGGGELYLNYLGRSLAGRGHEVALWASSHPRMDELCTLFGKVGTVLRQDYTNTYDRRFRSFASYFDRGSARAAAEMWRRHAPDIVHLNKQNLEDGLDLLRAAGDCGLPNLCTIHLTQSARYLRARAPWIRDWVARRALKSYPGPLVAVIEERRRDLAEFLGSDGRIHAIPNGVELYDLSGRHAVRGAVRRELGVAHDSLLLVAVGRMVRQKRPIAFLEYAARILKRLPHSRFVWVGDGKLAAEWDRWVAHRQLGNVIHRLPWRGNVRDVLFAADAFLHVAEFEGLPLAILEALSAGLPCAISPNLLREMPFLNDTNSVAIGEGDDWAAILADPAALAVRGKNARQLAEEQFSFDIMAARYEALYRGRLERRA